MKYLIIDKRQRVEVATMGEIPTGSVRLVEELENLFNKINISKVMAKNKF